MAVDLMQVSESTGRKELHWISGKKQELEVYRIPLEHLYFNIENGRYADKMLRLRQENQGQKIDARQKRWANEIEKMLAGEHRDTSQDKAAFEKLTKDIVDREQLRPGVCKFDGGVVDGNRRFAVLRRLHGKKLKTGKYGYFETVILPKGTSHEDLWRIEAGLQLGIDERWDYSPVNELLKIREGLELYTKLISQGKLKGTPTQRVAESIYGRTEKQIEEMFDRLRLIDDYLSFIGKRGQYDVVGRTSERFLEANRIVEAAKNQQYDPKKFAKLKAVLFFVIHTDRMDNWRLRDIYYAMGGDPKRKGRKPTAKNLKAFDDFLNGFPDSRTIRDQLTSNVNPETKPPKKTGTAKKSAAPKKTSKKQPEPKQAVDSAEVDVTIERFQQTMESTKKTKPPRTLAEAARVSLKALAETLSKKDVHEHLEEDFAEREAVLESLDDIGRLHSHCVSSLSTRKKPAQKKTPTKKAKKKSR